MGKSDENFYQISLFFRAEKFSPGKVSPNKVFQSGPNDKRPINISPLNSSRTFEAF